MCVTDRFGSCSPNFHYSVEYPAHRIALQILKLRIPNFVHVNECFGVFMIANQNREHIVLEKGNSCNHNFVEKCHKMIIVFENPYVQSHFMWNWGEGKWISNFDFIFYLFANQYRLFWNFRKLVKSWICRKNVMNCSFYAKLRKGKWISNFSKT